MLATDCLVAIEQLLAYVEDPERHRSGMDAAISHMRDCPDCEHRIGYLMQALRTGEEDQLNCQECKEQLPYYFQAERDGEADQARWRGVAYHLETCLYCATSYAELSDLVAFGQRERGVEPTSYQPPDLSFLSPGKVGPSQRPKVPWRLDDLGRLIIEFSAELLHAFQPPAYRPAYTRPGLKADRSSRVLCHVPLHEAIDDLEVTITAEETEENPAQCIVTVEVIFPSQDGWPYLTDTEVTIKRGELMLETQTIDAFGQAVFEGIATDELAHLVLEIDIHR